MELEYDSLYVGGEWVTPASSSKIAVVSASTEQVIGHVPEAVEADIDAAVGAARRAFDDPNGWAHWQPAQRAAAMERLASALDKRGEEMVRRIGSQNGMPVAVGSQLEAATTRAWSRTAPSRRFAPVCSAAARWCAANRSAWWAPSCPGTSRRRWRS
jgi:acyl-CoA reductase-like NAD-dependent aldehyde dehydrogenase